MHLRVRLAGVPGLQPDEAVEQRPLLFEGAVERDRLGRVGFDGVLAPVAGPARLSRLPLPQQFCTCSGSSSPGMPMKSYSSSLPGSASVPNSVPS